MSDASLRTRLIDDLRRIWDGDAWHGPSLSALLADVTAAEAAAHPVAGAHSIWELVLHLDAWTREVTRRLGGATPAEPADGDWPAVREATAAAWNAARARLGEAQQGLLAMLAALPPGRLDEPAPASGTAALSYGGIVSGVIQHDAYHGGQIGLLRKALRR
ncbi:MAG: DinB family protein [Gemmatimonadota bacterium]